MNNRNRNTIGRIAIALLVMISALGVAGVASAQQLDETTPIDNSTDSVYVDVVANDTIEVAPNVTVVVEGLPEGTAPGNGTQLMSETRTLTAGTTESFSYSLSQTEIDTYDSVSVRVETTGDGSGISSTDWGILAEMSGGGGGLLGSTGLGTTGLLVIVAIVGLFVVSRDD